MEENYIKKICKELGITYKELSNLIGYSESAIKNAAISEPSEPMKFAINLYLENQELKNKLHITEEFKKHLKDFLK